jgi:hypothetical protein
MEHPKHMPLPFHSDKKNLALLLNSPVPQTDQEKQDLEEKIGIKYCHAMGEVLYPMINVDQTSPLMLYF